MSINPDVPLGELGLQDVVEEVPDGQIPTPYDLTTPDNDDEEMPLDTPEIVLNEPNVYHPTIDTHEHISTPTDEMRSNEQGI